MNYFNSTHLSIVTFVSIVSLFGCNHSSQTSTGSDKKSLAIAGIDVSLFKQGAFIKDPVVVECKTSAGTSTTCYKLVTSGGPGQREISDFCPRTITDSADSVGGWFSKEAKGDLVDLTGEFIANLATYYDDPNWKLYDPETGKVRYTATKAACLGAARPDVEEQYKQNCIECQMAYLEDNFSRTYLIPTKPIPAARIERAPTIGIALDGAELSGAAPIDAILSSYTIAAFDDCGGHINEHQGYHYHSSTGCTDKIIGDDGYAPLIGYAADGYAIYGLKDAQGQEATSLDECRGTTDAIRGYHYRAASPSENQMVSCLKGEIVRPSGRGLPPHPPHQGPRGSGR